MMSRIIVVSFGVVFTVILAGCGGKKAETIVVKGKITKGAAPIQVQPMSGRVEISFYAMKDGQDPSKSDPQSSLAGTDGTFTIHGLDSKGIAAGKYKVAVRAISGNPADGMNDMLGGQFLIERTPIEVEVKKGESIEIDLDQWKKKP